MCLFSLYCYSAILVLMVLSVHGSKVGGRKLNGPALSVSPTRHTRRDPPLDIGTAKGSIRHLGQFNERKREEFVSGFLPITIF